MRSLKLVLPLVLLASLSLVPAAGAQKFRYASCPKPPEDSTLSVANSYLEPVVRSRGPRAPYTNLQLTQFVADTAVARARGPRRPYPNLRLPQFVADTAVRRVLASAGVDSGTHAVLAPARDHPLNFVLEHALLKALSRRGADVTVRHSPI